MIKLFSSIFYLCLSARGCVHPVTRTYTQNPAQPKNNCIQMNLYKSLVPMVSSSETHSQHKRPHKLLDRLFLNNHQTAWAWLPFRGTPVREGALYGSNSGHQDNVLLHTRYYSLACSAASALTGDTAEEAGRGALLLLRRVAPYEPVPA